MIYSVKKRLKIPIFSTFINNEILRSFERKNHGLVRGILEELLKLSEALLLSVVVQHIKNPAWAIKEQRAERGKRAVQRARGVS